MTIQFQCPCGRKLQAAKDFAGARGECPTCGQTITVPSSSEAGEGVAGGDASTGSSDAPPILVNVYLDPPVLSREPADAATAAPKASVMKRMFEALLDPRSIHWMLMIGGAICVLGLIIWLVSLGIFKDPHILAYVLAAGTLAVLLTGWFIALRTRFRLAGQALTFLGCVVAPLNLWFYHAQNLMTVDGHLWVGGVVCCLLYGVTVYVLRDALFMYACEAGVTLTALLLMADMGKITDTTYLSLFFMALGLISIHAERAFSPEEDSQFPRKRFGLPLFWSGHIQMGAALIILLGSQLLGWFVEPARRLMGFEWAGNLLTENYLLAAAIWLAAVYAYLYSDIIVRKVGIYLGLAGFSMVMVEVTALLGFKVGAEWIIAAMAITAVVINILQVQWKGTYKNFDRVVSPLVWVLSILPVAWGFILHLRATSQAARDADWTYETGVVFVVVMAITAISNRVSAFLCRHTDAKTSAGYFMLSAVAALIAAAGLLREYGLIEWHEQATWLMLIPIAYMIGSRLWRGHSAERPLYWVAHASTAVILAHVFLATLDNFSSFAPMQGQRASLFLGLVFTEAAAFYFLAGFFHRRSANVYLGAASACCGLWQLMGYSGIDHAYYTILYAVLGVACLAISRTLGIGQVDVHNARGEKSVVTRGRGLAAYHCGNGILTVAILAALLQGIFGLANATANRQAAWIDLGALALTVCATLFAAVIVPSSSWRRTYTTAAIALAAVTFLRLNLLIDLSIWQKLEIFCTVMGLALLIASHIANFREDSAKFKDSVSLGLDFGSLLASMPLLMAVLYHRWFGSGPSIYDEMALLTVSILMLVTGLSWQMRSTTLLGGGSLTLYLIVLVAMLAYHPQVAIGVYMAVGGGVVFALGIALSIYRDRLLEIPERVVQRKGIFRVLNWR